jgi:L-aspartate oxidase
MEATADGVAMALRAGVAVADVEFVQFHPTALDVPGAHCLPLITEALRGAGARLRDAGGRLLMEGLHPLGDLAPRDVVARRVWQARRDDGRAWLDASAITGEWESAFPTVLAACLRHGIDPRRQPIPVTPAAHFHMGGLVVDGDGRTSVPGLYAAGEVACNGVHGANRLASNSLLEGVVCGRRLGEGLSHAAEAVVAGPTRVVERGPSLPPAELAVLRELLWHAAGPIREARSLRDAWHACAVLAEAGWQAQLGKALLRAMRLRTRSLGAHWREDRGCPS